MAKTFYYLFREARPRQWIKNLSVFAAIFFTGKLLDVNLLITSFWAFIAFCAGSSSIYFFNDLTDLEKDKLHPFKRNRPLASGRLSKQTAIVTLVILSLTSLLIASFISATFFFIILIFISLHIVYSLFLKNVMLLDIMTIATGFILRVFGGEVATGYHISIWLLLTVVSAALFLAIGKRRSELTLLLGWEGSIPAKTRETLSHYSEKMLDVYISMFANSTWLTYALFTFLQAPPTLRHTLTTFVSANDLAVFQDRKFIMVTIPLVIYGIMRYLQLIYENNEGESPEKILLSDKPLMITGFVLGLVYFGIIYILGK